MRKPKSTKCRDCGGQVGIQNTSGYCRACAMKAAGKRRSEENAAFHKIVHACREAGHDVAVRVRQFLEEEQWQSDVSLAATMRERIIAKLPTNLQRVDIERMWQFEQYAVSLPALAVEARDGLVKLAYSTHLGQDHSAEEIKRHFESAIHRSHPEINVDWLWTESRPEKPNQNTS